MIAFLCAFVHNALMASLCTTQTSSTFGLATTSTVAVVGARGFSGLELVRLLRRHPAVESVLACRHQADFDPEIELPSARGDRSGALAPVSVISAESPADLLKQLPAQSVVFLATPASVSALWGPQLLAAGHDVLDLSGAFRFSGQPDQQQVLERWYGAEVADLVQRHSDATKEGIYGLQPFANFDQGTAKAGSLNRLIAVPGCYATSILIPLLPLLKAEVLDASAIVIDAKSGTTGAGRRAEPHLLAATTHGSLQPYRVGRHQHLPEIAAAATRFAGKELKPSLATHLADFRRGIQSMIYARPANQHTARTDLELERLVLSRWAEGYADYPLVDLAGSTDRRCDALLSLRRVVGTARCQLTVTAVDGRVYISSVIDNLLKGAASQAVENFNRMLGRPLSSGLSDLEGLI
jgi:N-acetyl-gamma-glutamyl-phosphate reductase